MAVRARLADLSRLIGGELIGPGEAEVTRLGPLDSADAHTLCFIANTRYAAQLAASRAGCVIVGPDLRPAASQRRAAIVCADPHLAWARLTQWWVAQDGHRPGPGIHPTAVIEAGARIDASASIGALCLVGRGATVGPNAVIGTHCVVGEDAAIGGGTWLQPRVSFLQGCRIGERSIIHSGAVIGADGFGYAPERGGWTKVEQLGTVVLGDDVEIGANTCIDRGALEDTVIGNGVKIDNLVQIAHNVHVGDHTAMAACTGIAGSTRIGRHCTFGGAAMVVGHIEIADHVHISGGALVSKSIRRPGLYSGSFPIDDNAAWEKNAATLRQLHGLRDRLRALEKARATEAKRS